VIEAYYRDALGFSLVLLRGIAEAIGKDRAFFDDKFDQPMALLRGNYYPPRPSWAGEKDFGIATHTDYGCLTLLASDGVPGLEVRLRGGGWLPVVAGPGEFVINFGEMLEIWTDGRVKATPHRVRGSLEERLSVPLFFNPNHYTNVAPMGSGRVISAGDHMQKRFAETYVHLKAG
jgi:isopenicillin N synthase-like dioxygenase